jgi:hypothetical protein
MAAVLDRDPTRRPASPIGAVPALALADLVEQVRPDLALLEIGSEDALAPREYPSLVPLANYSPEGCFDNHRAWRVFEQWTKPFICCFSDGDPITRGLDREFCERVPGVRHKPSYRSVTPLDA